MKQPMHKVILFDGVCNFCNQSVQFIIKRDTKNQFKFASLQGIYGQDVLKNSSAELKNKDSILLVENGKIYTESTAALRIAKQLNGLWPVLYAFIIIPSAIRNGMYKWVAKNRYKWFGKRDACMIPSPEQRSKFLP